MKKIYILVIAVFLSGFFLILSLVEFKNPISMPGNIEENMFVLAVGIDKATEIEDGFRLTIIGEKFTSSSGGSSESQGKIPDIVSVEGRTIFETIRQFNLFKSKSLFWGHIKYILISEDVAKENVLDVLDFFIRDHELRLNTTVAIIKGTSAEAFVRVGDKIEKFVPDVLDGTFHNISRLSYSKEIKLSDLMKNFDDEYSDAYVPYISLVTLAKDEVGSSSESTGQKEDTGGKEVTTNDKSTSNETDSQKKEYTSKEQTSNKQEGNSKKEGTSKEQSSPKDESSTGEQSSSTSPSKESSSNEVYYLNLDGYAIFDKFKLKGFISDYTSRGLNWVNGNVSSGVIVINDKKGKKISMEILRASSDIKTKFEGEIPEATVNIKFTTNLGEVMSQNDIFNEKDVKALKESQMEIVKKEAEDAINYAQTNGVDIIGISSAIYHQHTLKWNEIKKDWDDVFKKMKINVEVELNVNTTYHIRYPIGSKSGEE